MKVRKGQSIVARFSVDRDPRFLGGEYGHARVGFLIREDGIDYPRNPDECQPDGLVLDRLEVMCQWHREKDGTFSMPYGFDVQYSRPFAIDLRQGERMVKTLRMLTRKLDKLRQGYNGCGGFAQYVGWVCLALGVDHFAIPSRGWEYQSRYSDSTWTYVRPLDGMDMLTQAIDEHRR